MLAQSQAYQMGGFSSQELDKEANQMLELIKSEAFQALKRIAWQSIQCASNLKGQELETAWKQTAVELACYRKWFERPERFVEARKRATQDI